MSIQQLDAAEQRVLGVLLEKQLTVPATYPLTLSAVRTGCNQATSREPVTEYDEATVEAALRSLRHRDLVRVVWADTGRRTLKYHQLLDEVLALDAAERAVLTVLLLRGPQAPGELRTRTERLHGFTDRGQVETVLAALAGRDEPLVRRLPLQRGQQDPRWVHLLGPAPQVPGAVVDTESGADPDAEREGVLSDGVDVRDLRVRAGYDTLAEAYAEALVDELDVLPFERWLLDRVAVHAGDDPVVEVGCGPGHVTARLAASGVAATGIDVSPAMIEQARRRFPGVAYEVGDLRRLIRPDSASGWAAVLAWYSLVHLAASELPDAVAALARPLAPGGWLVIALHVGTQVRHVDALFGHEVSLDFVLHDRAAVLAAAAGAGLTVVEWYHRGPQMPHDEDTERLYVLARR